MKRAVSMLAGAILAGALVVASSAASAQTFPAYGAITRLPVDPVEQTLNHAGGYFRSDQWREPLNRRECRPTFGLRPFDCGRPLQPIHIDTTPSMMSALRKPIDARTAAAQAILGNAYISGDQTTLSPERAAYWNQAAAQQGHAPAQLALAEQYATGYGVTQDPRHALALYQASARAAYAPGQQAYAGYTQGRDYAVAPEGGLLHGNGAVLSTYGPVEQLAGGTTVLVFERQTGWSRVYVPQIGQWGWMRDSHVRFRF